MTQSIAILGRQPALGLAELESLIAPDKIHPIGAQAALLDLEVSEIKFSNLGGSVKLARVLKVIDTTDWNKIESYLESVVAEYSVYLPDGKMSLGLSVYGLSVKPSRINATGLQLKKILKASGRGVRVIPNKTPDLSSAQVLHNNLTGARAWELLFVCDGKQTYIAQTTNVQDITAYASRDQARPKRDARVGMLPPKLAQIILNLAVNKQTVDSRQQTVLDPFCGTGVVLQEALLMGYKVYGTDLEPRMVEYSKTNLDWLSSRYNLEPSTYNLSVGDATNHLWQQFDVIAAETYLGRPFSALPSPQILNDVMQDVDTIHRKFLKNVASQTKPGFKMCIAVPAWKTPQGFKHLKMLDSLEEFGYTRLSFAHVRNQELIYHRPEQIVGRELVVLIRK